jgi:thiamine biosynthesis lipoprotein
MGTVASVHVYDPVADDVADAAIAQLRDELERLEQMFSTFRPTSEISRVNDGSMTLADCSPEVIDVLDACTWLEHSSNGAFDIRVGGRLDPAGFVKGWAAERAAERLVAGGLGRWSLGLGGDVLVHGSPGAAGEPWIIAITDPHRPGHARTAVTIDGGAVATSGTAERGHHLRDASGAAADVFASLTVIGPSLTWADAFATTAFAIGADGLDWVTQFDGYRAFAIAHDGTLVNTVEI